MSEAQFTYGPRQTHPEGFHYRTYTLRTRGVVCEGLIDEALFNLTDARAMYEKRVVAAVENANV